MSWLTSTASTGFASLLPVVVLVASTVSPGMRPLIVAVVPLASSTRVAAVKLSLLLHPLHPLRGVDARVGPTPVAAACTATAPTHIRPRMRIPEGPANRIRRYGPAVSHDSQRADRMTLDPIDHCVADTLILGRATIDHFT